MSAYRKQKDNKSCKKRLFMFPQKNNAAFGGTKKITREYLMANKFALTGHHGCTQGDTKDNKS